MKTWQLNGCMTGFFKICSPENKTFSKVKPDSRPLELMYFMMRLKVLLYQSRLEKILKPVFHRFHFKAMFICYILIPKAFFYNGT